MNVDSYRASATKLVRNPDDPEALVTQFANVSEKLENAEFYLPLAKRAFEVAPNEISAIFNYASALNRTGRFWEGLQTYLRALPRVTEEWEGRFLHHVGISYRAIGDNHKAIEFYRRAYEVTGDPRILKDAAIARLATGELQRGFEEFEIRKECAKQRLIENSGKLIAQQKLPPETVYWNGESLHGKSVLVYHEEGQGDFVQFCRYIPQLRELGAEKIILTGAARSLLDLVSENLCIDGIADLSGPHECDYAVGSMSIPWRVGISSASLSGKPYFSAEKADLPQRGALNVGLVWRGNPEYGQDVHRSMAFTEYSRLFDIPGTAFYSLQKGALDVTESGFDGFVANLDGFMSSWSDTARLVSCMDLVVSVDTAVAHLAGALGVPVCILTTNAADWRWNRNSEKTAWYDSARVIRQKKQGDWAPCLERVREIIQGMLNERKRAA